MIFFGLPGIDQALLVSSERISAVVLEVLGPSRKKKAILKISVSAWCDIVHNSFGQSSSTYILILDKLNKYKKRSKESLGWSHFSTYNRLPSSLQSFSLLRQTKNKEVIN